MTDSDAFLDSDSRRSFMKKSALATGGLALTGAATGAATAQEDDDDDGIFFDDEVDNENQMQAAIYSTNFRPGAKFIITSPVINWVPNVDPRIGSRFTRFNTRALQYVATNEQVLYYQAESVEIPQYDPDLGYVPDPDEDDTLYDDTSRPQLYTFGYDQNVFGENRSGLLDVTFAPVTEDEQDEFFDDEDDYVVEDDEPGILF